MRVAQFCDTFMPVVDGVGRVVSKYAYELGSRCERCYVVAPEVADFYRGDLPFDVITYLGMPLHQSPQYQVGLPIADPHYRKRAAAMKADILHAHTPFAAGYEALRYAQKHHVPLVGTFHSKYYDDFYQATGSSALSQFGTDIIVRFFEKCDEVWTVSSATAEVLRNYGFKGEIIIMDNGCDLKEPDASAAAEVSARYGFDSSPLLLFVGQMNWKKNIRRIIEALALCRKDGLPMRLAMAGQGPHLEEIKELVHSLMLDDSVVFTGHITDNRQLDGLYARADLFVFPSLYDNAPMVVREAAALGTPSLLVRGSSASEVIHDGENGFLCADDSADAARVIQAALADKEKLIAAGTGARNTIPRSWNSVITEVIGRYDALIQANAAAQLNVKRTSRVPPSKA